MDGLLGLKHFWFVTQRQEGKWWKGWSGLRFRGQWRRSILKHRVARHDKGDVQEDTMAEIMGRK
jgi:hypothetical protein